MADQVVKESETRALAEALKKTGEVESIELDPVEFGRIVLSVPEGRKLVSVKPFADEYLERPERTKGTARVQTLGSFIDLTGRHQSTTSALFVDSTGSNPKMTAVIDYHDGQKTNWSQHRIVYPFPLSPEWTAWTKIAPFWLSQTDLAEFLESRIDDVLDPAAAGDSTTAQAKLLGLTLASPTRLLELSRGLTIRVGARVTQAVNLSTGEAQIGFEEKHEGDGGPLKIPGGFVVAIPVFRGGAQYQVPVRLRYRVKDGSVTWSCTPQRVEQIWDHAIAEACEQAVVGTSLPLYHGEPE